MTEEYTGPYLLPAYARIETDELKDTEFCKRDDATKLSDVADGLIHDADQMLWEQNYRKHYKTLKPLQDRQSELTKIIHDPKTSKTAREKAEWEDDKLYKVFWGVVRYGKHAPSKDD